jgi:hypothetical protein
MLQKTNILFTVQRDANAISVLHRDVDSVSMVEWNEKFDEERKKRDVDSVSVGEWNESFDDEKK